jgi:hypothetical protein
MESQLDNESQDPYSQPVEHKGLTLEQKKIIGGTAGGLVVLIAIILIIVLVVLPKRNGTTNDHKDPASPLNPNNNHPDFACGSGALPVKLDDLSSSNRVYVLDAAMTTKQLETVFNYVFTTQGGTNPENNGQFSDLQFAILLKPGSYDMNVQVGYYTSVIGLGKTPSDVVVNGTVQSLDGSTNYQVGGLDNFWRSVENLTINNGSSKNQWSISQGAFWRRVIVKGDLYVFEIPGPSGDSGYTSGGFMADCKFEGGVFGGSQQQFCFRNCEFSAYDGGGVFNMMFLGSTGAPPSHCTRASGTLEDTGTAPSVTTVDATPLIQEKPQLFWDSSGYNLLRPPSESGKVGASKHFESGQVYTNIFFTKSGSSSDCINQALKDGKHVVITPGIYKLKTSISIERSDTMLMGCGYPILISSDGKPCITVSDKATNVQMGGFIIQAGEKNTPTLIEFGETSGGRVSSYLYDCFARIGGPDKTTVSADVAVTINHSGVITDNLHLWRADHGVDNNAYIGWGNVPSGTGQGTNGSKKGIVVNGHFCSAYGLAVEHFEEVQVEWNGNNGVNYMYQGEFPYAAPASYQKPGYVVNGSGFNLVAAGLYCYWRDHSVNLREAFSIKTDTTFTKLFTLFLNGKGSISRVTGHLGLEVKAQGETSYVCSRS